MNKKSYFRNAALCAGAMLISLGAMAEAPDSSVVVQTKTVKYNRAEATTTAGAEQLYGSLNLAVARVCVDSAEPAFLQGAVYAQCRDAALAQAVDEIGIQAVTALHAQDNRVRSPKGSVSTENLNQ
jgi:UrcA family protein